MSQIIRAEGPPWFLETIGSYKCSYRRGENAWYGRGEESVMIALNMPYNG